MSERLFEKEIFGGIEPPTKKRVEFAGLKMPNNQDIYFVSKWHEVFDRYSSARLFLNKCFETDYDYWFDRLPDEKIQKAMELIIKSNLFETALINYNILVDLTWAWTYVSAEYVLYKFDNDGNVINSKDITGMHPIEESYEMLRKTENGTASPHVQGNPFSYLKMMAPEFSGAVDTIIEFWKNFSESNIHNLYNYIKHKGKPNYEEIDEIKDGRFFSMYIGKDEYPTDIRDVQKIVSLDEYIEELIKFDNKVLYPYIEKLLEELKTAVNPSPLVI